MNGSKMFKGKNPIKMDDLLGYPYDSGNHHMAPDPPDSPRGNSFWYTSVRERYVFNIVAESYRGHRMAYANSSGLEMNVDMICGMLGA